MEVTKVLTAALVIDYRISMKKFLNSTVILFLLSLPVVFVPFKEARALDLQGFKFSDSYRYAVVEDSGLEDFNGPLILTGSFAHVDNPFFLTNAESTQYLGSIIEQNNMLTFGLFYKYNDLIKMGFESSIQRVELAGTSKTNLGDTALKLRWNLFKNERNSFSLNPSLSLPTGKVESYTTKDSVGAALRAVYEHALNGFHFLGSAGVSHASKNELSIIDYRNLALFELAFSVDLTETWNANVEINRNFTFSSDYHQDEGDYYVTVKNKTTSFLNTYGGFGVAGLNDLDKKNWTVFAGLKMEFAPNK